MAKAQADAQGFILILPDNPGQNCWAVGTTQGLTHDGGGDTQALAQMIQYVLKQYNADPARVYIMGGSGGAMYVQAMLAVYPNLITGGLGARGRCGGLLGGWLRQQQSVEQQLRGRQHEQDGATVGRRRSGDVSGLHGAPAAHPALSRRR